MHNGYDSYLDHHNHPHLARLVDQILPDHIKQADPMLALFAEKLIDFLEHNNKAAYYVNRIQLMRDIDETDTLFLTELQRELGAPIPRIFAANPRVLYKHVVEMYRSRGTPASIDAFFRLLYDDEVEIYFPKEDLFIPSDGTWFDQSEDTMANPSLYTPTYTFTIDQLTNIINGKLHNQFTGDGTTTIFTLSYTPASTEHLKVDSDISYTLENGNEVHFSTPPASGDVIDAHMLVSDDTQRIIRLSEFLVYVNGSKSETHTIKADMCEPFDRVVYSVEFLSELQVGDVVKLYNMGSFATNDSFTDDYKKVQDSFFYQKFSYVLRTGANIDKWKNAFNRLIHPGGFIFFGEILLLIQKDDVLLPFNQPGYQTRGLPFPIVINPVDIGITNVKVHNNIMASYVDVSFVNTDKPGTDFYDPSVYRSHETWSFAQAYIERRKFDLITTQVGSYGEYTFNTNINKDIRFVMDTEVTTEVVTP